MRENVNKVIKFSRKNNKNINKLKRKSNVKIYKEKIEYANIKYLMLRLKNIYYNLLNYIKNTIIIVGNKFRVYKNSIFFVLYCI